MKRYIHSFLLLSAVFFSMGTHVSCEKEKTQPQAPALPTVSVADAQVERLATPNSAFFFVVLDKQSTQNVSVAYRLKDGTAIIGTDYTGNAGTITIPAGSTSVSLEVSITGDNLRRPNNEFSIELYQPTGCTLLDSVAICTIVNENGARLPTNNAGFSTPATYPDYSLVWADEFDGNVLQTSFWNYEIGNGSNGWGNNERQYYTAHPKNVFVSEGNLIIEARKDNIDGFAYSSARLTTKSKREFQFGRIDIRAKLPKGQGVWPALWMLGANISDVGWPRCGEIDIMELIGHEPNKVHGTLHWNGTNGHAFRGGSKTLSSGNFSDAFHVFSIVWKQNQISWYVDNVLFYSMSSADFGGAVYPFNAPQFFIFNVAVGGNWPGYPDGTTVFPQRMFVDYIRIFQ
jgi:beta-glucanase (GH16 family)